MAQLLGAFTPQSLLRSIRDFRLSRHQVKAGVLLFVLYMGITLISRVLSPGTGILVPATAIALSTLFLEGLELWPVIFLASLILNIQAGLPIPFILIIPVAQTVQASAGAILLRLAKIDPLFRKARDMFMLFGIVIIVSLIVPGAATFAEWITVTLTHRAYPLVAFNLRYVATIFSLLMLTPFVLRWFAKPRFSRTPLEVLETATVFLFLILANYFLFIRGVTTFIAIPLVYLLLIPLFWISLRLRPRFVTLALLLTSIFAIGGLYVGPTAVLPVQSGSLFTIETFLIALSVIFFVIVSLEESRRLNTYLMRSQLATLENAMERVSSESKAKNDFIAVLAHELRNPLAPVVTSIELMKLKEGIDPEERDTLLMMEDRMLIVRRLLDDLLDISRITEGKVMLSKQPVQLESIIRQSILSTAHHLKERHQSLTYKSPEQEIIVEGDPVRLEQIFSNLITNASKYSNSGDPICVVLEKKGRFATVRIIDEGLGISEDSLDKIFVPFHQIDNGDRTKKGLGIGLALVQNFVEMHDGTVTAASEGKGKGSTFTVQLPLALTVAAQKRSDAKKSKALKNAAIRILINTDNDAVASNIGKLIELRGYEVEYAYDDAHVVHKTIHQPPDAIIIDVGLPDHPGFKLAAQLREKGYDGILIALTSYSTEESRNREKDSGFDHRLVKPVTMTELRKVLPTSF